MTLEIFCNRTLVWLRLFLVGLGGRCDLESTQLRHCQDQSASSVGLAMEPGCAWSECPGFKAGSMGLGAFPRHSHVRFSCTSWGLCEKRQVCVDMIQDLLNSVVEEGT